MTASDRVTDRTAGTVRGHAVLTVAAIASLAAGAIHATAAGAHSEHRAAVVAFVLTATAQLGWGAWALRRGGGRLLGLTGVAVNGAAVGGWLLAKTSGIGFVAGLDAKESPQFADTVAAMLAVTAVAGAVTAFDRGLVLRPGVSRLLTGIAALVAVALVIPGMVLTGSHTHGGTDHADGEHEHEAPPPVPYTATLPVDLGGVPGVSDEQVAQAEALVTAALQKLPRFGDIPTIEAMGYRSIGDANTGFEHFINWSLVTDGRVLDPDYPESLVFTVDQRTGTRTLSAAMFIANPGDTLGTVPDFGGALVQWHVHDDLCYAGEPMAWRVADVVEPGQECRPGTFRLGEGAVPMVHVWIVPHACGPFAALEGVGAGQIRPGEERLCDHAHGVPD